MSNLYLSGVTRLEIIDHTKCSNCHGVGKISVEGQPDRFECPTCRGLGMGGREVIMHDPAKQITVQLQDQNRTLKIFVNEREVDV